MPIVFLDFKKAFDMIDHNKLLRNCVDIGVRAPLVGWLASYLHERKQITKYEGEIVMGGVPQGSKLGPVTFAIMTNNLPSVLDCGLEENEGDTTMFMDDTTLSEILDMSQF